MKVLFVDISEVVYRLSVLTLSSKLHQRWDQQAP